MNKRLLFLLVATLISLSNMAAGGPTFYYRFIAQPSTTGEGLVYASNLDETPDDSQYHDYYGTQVFSEGTMVNVHAATVTAFLYAKPAEGYMFTHWCRVEDGKETAFSRSKNTTDLITTKATDIQNPLVTYYKAYFAKKGLIYPQSSDESLGTVDIDIATNKIGDVVTLTAKPDMLNGVFKGWRRNESTRLITDNPLTLKVSTSNRGTYTAVYEAKGINTHGLYMIIENLATNTLLGVVGNSEKTIESDQRYFKNSLVLVNKNNPKVHSMPALIVKVTGNSTGTAGLENVEMSAQGVSTYDISGQKFRVEKYLDNDYFLFGNHDGFTGYIKDNGGEKSYMELVGQVHNPSIWNRPDAGKRYRWAFHIIDEESFDTNYFGALPSPNTKLNGKYYTTMYTSFPYECRDGVKAYIVDKILEDGKAHLMQVSENIVPANTPVILECNSTEAIGNRLMPLLYDPLPVTTTNLLKGEVYLNDESGDESNFRTTFDPTTMRVLSNDKAVFANANNKDPLNGNSTLKYIASNTCYLDVSGIDNPAVEIELSKDEDDVILRGDANGDGTVDVVDAMLCVNYVLRKEIKMFIFKNADVNFDNNVDVTDIMDIINYILKKHW